MTPERFNAELAPRLRRHGVYHFSPAELCPIGKRADQGKGPALQAPPLGLCDNAIPTLIRLEHGRARVREKVPGAIIHVSSGYRDPAYNRAEKGGSESLHLMFNAFDVKALVKRDGVWRDALPASELADILESFPDQDRFGLGRYDTFVHLDTRGYLGLPAPARW